MIRAFTGSFLLAFCILPAASAQRPLLHYHYDEGGSPAAASNVGTLPGASPIIGFNQTGAGANGTSCLTGIGGTTGQIATPLTMSQGNNAWSIGFAIKNGIAGGVNFVCSENVAA